MTATSPCRRATQSPTILTNKASVLPFGRAVAFSGQPLDGFAVEHNDLISQPDKQTTRR
jgi:hypothetical protein